MLPDNFFLRIVQIPFACTFFLCYFSISKFSILLIIDMIWSVYLSLSSKSSFWLLYCINVDCLMPTMSLTWLNMFKLFLINGLFIHLTCCMTSWLFFMSYTTSLIFLQFSSPPMMNVRLEIGVLMTLIWNLFAFCLEIWTLHLIHHYTLERWSLQGQPWLLHHLSILYLCLSRRIQI